MRVLAVIPAYNALTLLPEVLDALNGQVDGVIAVDNASTDGTADWLRIVALSQASSLSEGPISSPAPPSSEDAARFRPTPSPPLVLIANVTNLGYAIAVNQGIARALADGADAVLLVNDDAVFQPGAVAALVRALAGDATAGAVTAKLLYRDRPAVLNGTGGRFWPHRGWVWLRGEGELDRGQYDDQPFADYPSGAASLLRRAALEDVGVMDEAYYLYHEDAEWGLRAHAAGWHTRYEPAAVVLHVGSAGTAGDPARRRYYNVRNRLRLAGAYASRRGRVWAWAATLCLAAKQVPRALWPRRRRGAAAVWWGVADHLRGRYGRSRRWG